MKPMDKIVIGNVTCGEEISDEVFSVGGNLSPFGFREFILATSYPLLHTGRDGHSVVADGI